MTPKLYSKLSPLERKALREEYTKEQEGNCSFCGKPLDGPSKALSKPVDKRLFPPNFFKHPVHLHHNHDTDETIGAVHAHCNAVLWQYYGE